MGAACSVDSWRLVAERGVHGAAFAAAFPRVHNPLVSVT